MHLALHEFSVISRPLDANFCSCNQGLPLRVRENVLVTRHSGWVAFRKAFLPSRSLVTVLLSSSTLSDVLSTFASRVCGVKCFARKSLSLQAKLNSGEHGHVRPDDCIEAADKNFPSFSWESFFHRSTSVFLDNLVVLERELWVGSVSNASLTARVMVN